MALHGTRYPVVLRAVMNHAQRLRAFIAERENHLCPGEAAAPWLIGRAGEIQCVVALVTLDWHHERLSTEAAAARLARYLKDLHDGLAMHIDVAMPPCCQSLQRLIRGTPAKAQRATPAQAGR
jgi:hypothetical protein